MILKSGPSRFRRYRTVTYDYTFFICLAIQNNLRVDIYDILFTCASYRNALPDDFLLLRFRQFLRAEPELLRPHRVVLVTVVGKGHYHVTVVDELK